MVAIATLLDGLIGRYGLPDIVCYLTYFDDVIFQYHLSLHQASKQPMWDIHYTDNNSLFVSARYQSPISSRDRWKQTCSLFLPARSHWTSKWGQLCSSDGRVLSGISELFRRYFCWELFSSLIHDTLSLSSLMWFWAVLRVWPCHKAILTAAAGHLMNQRLSEVWKGHLLTNVY